MKTKQIEVNEVRDTVRKLCIKANTFLGKDVVAVLEKGLASEKSPNGRHVFRQLLENAKIANEQKIPLCQDTGMVVVFIELGQDVHLVGGDLNEAVNEGVRLGYREGYLRASTLDPVVRENFGDNTPAVIHVEVVPGDKLRLNVVPKGFGSENMSRVKLFPPAAGIKGVKRFVVDRVAAAGPNPCPPIVVGVGIGGTMEKAALIAKKSLLRSVGKSHPEEHIARFEKELLADINKLGIGPQGLGGTVTALAVHVETFPTHIGSLPVAVNFQCHCARHKEAVL